MHTHTLCIYKPHHLRTTFHSGGHVILHIKFEKVVLNSGKKLKKREKKEEDQRERKGEKKKKEIRKDVNKKERRGDERRERGEKKKERNCYVFSKNKWCFFFFLRS